MIADREGDIYEEFAGKPDGVELLIRAAQDRVLADGTSLFSGIEQRPELGRETIILPAGPCGLAREAVLSLRACQVTIKRPQASGAGRSRHAAARDHAEPCRDAQD